MRDASVYRFFPMGGAECHDCRCNAGDRVRFAYSCDVLRNIEMPDYSLSTCVGLKGSDLLNVLRIKSGIVCRICGM